MKKMDTNSTNDRNKHACPNELVQAGMKCRSFLIPAFVFHGGVFASQSFHGSVSMASSSVHQYYFPCLPFFPRNNNSGAGCGN
jgi:hypothetical protein